jgi:ubiquinone/menaquinone biosynthesis C-methylase UbiE
MSDATAERGGHAHGHTHGHAHDDVDWAAQAALLTASDTLEVGRNQAIVDWLGIGDGDVAVEVGSGAGGMAAALLDAVGTAGTVIIVDGAPELLELAQRRVRRPGHHLVALHADVDAQPLGSVLQERHPVDVVYASAVVHHLDDELAAVREFAAVVRPGGRVAIAEGGLGHRYLPDDCGIGEPGLEHRLAAAHEAWFWNEVRPATATVRRGWGWNVLLADAGLIDIATRSFLLDVPPPLDAATRRGVRAVFERDMNTIGDRISDEDRAALTRLLDDDDAQSVMRRPDVFVLDVRTVHAGSVPE